jgi:hypothetical protein
MSDGFVAVKRTRVVPSYGSPLFAELFGSGASMLLPNGTILASRVRREYEFVYRWCLHQWCDVDRSRLPVGGVKNSG